MVNWLLDYDSGLFLQLPFEDALTINVSAFYKMSLKRHVSEFSGDILRFKDYRFQLERLGIFGQFTY